MKDWMIVVLVIVVASGIVFFGFGWMEKHDPLLHGPRITALSEGSYGYFSSEVKTFGNRSFIPIGWNAAPADYTDGIGKIVEGFRRTHPKLRVTTWSVDWKMGRSGSSIHDFWIDGIWIDHVPVK